MVRRAMQTWVEVVTELLRGLELPTACLISSLIVIATVLVTAVTSPAAEEPPPRFDTVDGPSCPSNRYRHNSPHPDSGIRCS